MRPTSATSVRRRRQPRRIEADFGTRVTSIYHAAGELADATVTNQTRRVSFWRAAAAKLGGAWNLDACTRGHDLERFVLFSSAAALVGTPGQSSYAAANAGLDALAAQRRATGLAALSVNWGAFASGMAADLATADAQRMEAAGVTPLREADAWNALAELCARNDTNAMVMAIDWSRFVAARFPNGAPSSLFRAVGAAAPAAAANGATHAGLLNDIASRAGGERRSALTKHLQQRVAAILGRPDPDGIRPTQGFFALGMDSLTSLELRNQLEPRSRVRALANPRLRLRKHRRPHGLPARLRAGLGRGIAAGTSRARYERRLRPRRSLRIRAGSDVGARAAERWITRP